MKRMMAVLFCGLLLLATEAFAFQQHNDAGEELASSMARVRLQNDYAGVAFYQEGAHPARIYGVPFGSGTSPEVTADGFRMKFSRIFGVAPEDLRPLSLLYDQRHTQPVKYDRETDAYEFTLVYYSQFCGGIPVFRADLRLLVRNEAGYPLVWVGSALRDIGDFKVPPVVSSNASLIESAIKGFSPDLIGISQPRLVVWAGIDDMTVSPTVAIEVIADNGRYATPEYSKWLFLIDVATGEILFSENMILNVNVTGSVRGMATTNYGADICEVEASTPLPFARVYINDQNPVFTNSDGYFTIPNAGSSPVTVFSHLRGQWFRVYNQQGSDAELTITVTPPGPANFLHNSSNISEFYRAQVNGYYQANIVRSLVAVYNPSYPGISQNEFPVNVNINDVCNANYNGNSINFFAAGGGCPNTAFGTIVHHEYGHHLVSMGGSGQGQYGEGMGDVMGILITDDPGLAYGFFSNCNQPLRTADNIIQYPCSGEIHYCGQLLSGCVWDTRNALAVSFPTTYQDILPSLAINAMLLHAGMEITPQITIDYLILDDEDGNIYNGTPHFIEICSGFSAHNMDCPLPEPIAFSGPVNYGAGYRPQSVFSADLDGDGDYDLAVANSYSDNVSVLKNNGNGTFQAAVNYGAGDGPTSVFCVDLDSDGDYDLAVANGSSNNVSILKNNGNGTFQAAVNYGVVGSYPISVFCADLDGDSDYDLAVANNSINSNNVSVLKNNGDGTFQAAASYGAGNRPSSVFCADLDGDGDYDLAVTNDGSNNVSILKNYGNGAFQAAVNYGVGSWPISVFCADLDADGDYDLAVANLGSDTASILKNNGNGTFQAAVNYGAGDGPYSVFCSDLDGDGDNDLAVANSYSDNVSILKNYGNGRFQAAVSYLVGDGPSSVFCADLDGDGDNDLAVANVNSGNVSVLLNLSISQPPPPTCCDVNMVPDSSPINVPPGGSFGLTGTIGNPTNAPIVTDVWVSVETPSGMTVQLYTFDNIPLNPAQAFSAHLNQQVPMTAPPGLYRMRAACGDRPIWLVCDEVSFPFTITGARINDGYANWTLEGGWNEGSSGQTNGLMPHEYALSDAYPNPFNATVTITYGMPMAGKVDLEVYNLLGQRVATLVDGNIEAGHHTVTWDASQYSSGIYFYRLAAGEKVFTKRMTLLK